MYHSQSPGASPAAAHIPRHAARRTDELQGSVTARPPAPRGAPAANRRRFGSKGDTESEGGQEPGWPPLNDLSVKCSSGKRALGVYWDVNIKNLAHLCKIMSH